MNNFGRAPLGLVLQTRRFLMSTFNLKRYTLLNFKCQISYKKEKASLLKFGKRKRRNKRYKIQSTN